MMEGHEKHKSVLQEYYARYLLDVRGVSKATVGHYWEALRYISQWLKSKGLVVSDIYEVETLEHLEQLREIIYTDKAFDDLNRRGNQMYSAGLNNYIRFAAGEDFQKRKEKIHLLDIPVIAKDGYNETHYKWKRSDILRGQAMEYAGYVCEMDSVHSTFIAEKTHKRYMEVHHVIPMHLQGRFSCSLDVYANLLCLCPVCHRKIHLGLKEERREMMDKIYEMRIERLTKSGLQVGKYDFEDMGLDLVKE